MLLYSWKDTQVKGRSKPGQDPVEIGRRRRPRVTADRECPVVLVVEDDPRQRTMLRLALGREYAVVEAANGREGLQAFFDHRPDLVVLDAHMPELDGWQTLRRIRDLADTPVIMLTAFGSDPDVIRGLRDGADEYVTKPASPAVLVARVEALLRRAAGRPADQTARLEFDEGRLVIDRATGRVWVRGEEIQLSATEYRLLTYLAEHAARLLSPAQILAAVWGDDYRDEVGYVKSYVRMLRAKIEQDPRKPRYLVVRRGLGYMLVPKPGDG
jgi:DNA-binding response OmpR family regulator